MAVTGRTSAQSLAGRLAPALSVWSRFVQLSPRIGASTSAGNARESAAELRDDPAGLITRSFISLRQLRDATLDDFATEILAHEIGHHVYCPAT
jgi:hypothetical protein